jgi:hypothetical protein
MPSYLRNYFKTNLQNEQRDRTIEGGGGEAPITSVTIEW